MPDHLNPAPSSFTPKGGGSTLSRRRMLLLSAGALTGAHINGVGTSVLAAADTESHGMSAFGDLKYPPDFRHFDYVNPNAPKGGLFSQIGPGRQLNQNFLTFNSLNSYILKGDGAQGMERTFATLMERAFDEPDAMYGLVGARGAHLGRRSHLSVSTPSGSAIPRRHAADGTSTLRSR